MGISALWAARGNIRQYAVESGDLWVVNVNGIAERGGQSQAEEVAASMICSMGVSSW